MTETPSSDFLPRASLAMLRLRAAMFSHLRAFFEQQGYWEVDTPVLSHDIVVDAWLDPFSTDFVPDGAPDRREELFLQTSPEFAMKRLLAAGAEAIYQLGKAFRNGEVGPLHNPEFTMLEWYRVGVDHHHQMNFTERLVREFFAGVTQRGGEIGITGPTLPTEFLRWSYDEAFEQAMGTRVLSLSADELRDLARARKLLPPPNLVTVDDWLNFLLVECVEPVLREQTAVFLYDYPASQAALAKIRNEGPPVAERFELYLHGVEICNGYHELTDARELERRMRKQMEIRTRAGKRTLPLENRLLQAMSAGLPESSGVALGFDRLLMLAVGAKSLHEVLAFPHECA